MKRVFLVLFLTVCSFSQLVNAEVIPTVITDKLYSDGTWYPSTTASMLSVNNKDGIAWRFVLDQSWTVSSISGFMAGVNLERNPGYARFSIYQGSNFRELASYPGGGWLQPNTKIYQSDTFNVLDKDVKQYKIENLNIELPTGEYWFGASGSGGDNPGPAYVQLVDYKLEGQVTTPEPATMLLLGGGLAGAIWRRRKFTKA